jgi:hypothetical protein
MVKKGKFSYPVTKSTIHKYAKSIFNPIQRGECVTTVWVPMAGRRMWNKFVIENINLFRKELPNYKKYLLVYIEPLDLTEESLAGYLRLMGKSFVEVCQKNSQCAKAVDLKSSQKIFEDDSATYSKLLSSLRSLVSKVGEHGFRVVFFLGEFDELSFVNKIFFNNLKSLWSGMYPIVHYIFLMRERVTKAENIDLWGELNEAILQNVVYIPLLADKDFKYVVDRMSDQFAINLKSKQIKVLKELCGGHPYLVKVCLRVMSNNKDKKLSSNGLSKVLRNYYELQSVSRGILNVRGDKEKSVLRKIAKGKSLSGRDEGELADFMTNLGIIKLLKGKKYKLFGALFKEAVLGSSKGEGEIHEEPGKELNLDEESGAILYNGHTVEEKFTRQEYSVLRMFLEDAGKLKSRDDIGDILWGKESYEKYSDWAIDQLMSKLRRKLVALGVSDRVVTVRGKGYKLI